MAKVMVKVRAAAAATLKTKVKPTATGWITIPPNTPAKAINAIRLERLVAIDAMLRAQKKVNATQISARFEISQDTVVRDMAYMRNRFGMAIEYDNRTKSYF